MINNPYSNKQIYVLLIKVIILYVRPNLIYVKG